MNINDLSKKFLRKYPEYLSFAENLVNIIRHLLKEHEIDHLSVDYRIKNLEQFTEKIQRKKYNDPFEEMEDICGIRIICYFQRDIKKIEKILKKQETSLTEFFAMILELRNW